MNRYPVTLELEEEFLAIRFDNLPVTRIALRWVNGVLSGEYFAAIDKHDDIYVKVSASRLEPDVINFDVLYPRYVTGADIESRWASIPVQDLKAAIEDGKPKHFRAA